VIQYRVHRPPGKQIACKIPVLIRLLSEFKDTLVEVVAFWYSYVDVKYAESRNVGTETPDA
jgi:hypothetical protein